MIGNYYRKRPVTVTAIQYDGSNADRIIEFGFQEGIVLNEGRLVVPTLEGEMTVSEGDYVIRGVQGEVYPCKPDIFEQTYERLT